MESGRLLDVKTIIIRRRFRGGFMKKFIISILVIFAVGLLACDNTKGKKFPFGSGSDATGSASDSETTTETAGGNQPPDQNNDQKDDTKFNYQTVHDVTFDLQLYDETNNPLGKAVIRVKSEEGDVTTAVSAENGTAAFKTTLSDAIGTISLIIEHPDCVSKTVEINNIQKLALVNRSIFLELRAESKPKPDRDKDGVPDDSDEFPDDPTLIGSNNGEYTIAFEDNWPKKGDADFNDMVVKIGIKEFIDNNNMTSKITVTSRLLAAGANYKNQLWISVLGKDYQLIFNPKQDLTGKYNTKKGEAYVQGPEHKLDIVLPAPVARDQMDAMPYDPYIKCNGNDKNQVHLSFVKSKFKDKTLDSDNFPWAILVPTDWSWPYEGASIFQAYPDFQKWYESQGKEYKDWYLRPEIGSIYKVSVGSALAAYILNKPAYIPAGFIIGILAVIFVSIMGINFLRKRSRKMSA